MNGPEDGEARKDAKNVQRQASGFVDQVGWGGWGTAATGRNGRLACRAQLLDWTGWCGKGRREVGEGNQGPALVGVHYPLSKQCSRASEPESD